MLKLNPNPTFEAEVEITVPGQQETGTVKLTFKYLGRKEYRAMVDSWDEVKEPDKLDKGGKIIKEGKVIKPATLKEDAFLQIVTSWDLPEPFNLENVQIFLNNYPAAYMDIFTQYSKLLLQSRLKN